MYVFTNPTKTEIKLRDRRGRDAVVVEIPAGRFNEPPPDREGNAVMAPATRTGDRRADIESVVEVDDALALRLLDTSHPSGKLLASLIADRTLIVTGPSSAPAAKDAAPPNVDDKPAAGGPKSIQDEIAAGAAKGRR